ncbi:acyl-CoA dehydrogenase [Streptomyces sp. 5-8]|uniref:Acyl-CoA dehydrogenase n=1 Tax=Streptomyces musisoli TaxID=2802280 RepID=A0ABS1NSR2_9ACTN|nr:MULTISPECIES: acyl-CoA dehydrogenase [Streptomyces]MBL1103063.1 acyl-CoA dehydrogenase [Streptomyces musisoli]MBY8840955.1 acyl-CoA dehydrogenase [Streptomyces sp. SP2-10]
MDETTELLTRQWHFPDLADEAALARLWKPAAALGWFDRGSLAGTVALVRATGAAACPLPVMDGFVAAGLLTTAPEIVAGIAAGDVRILVAAGDPAAGTVQFAECGTAASHVLVLPPAGGRASVRPVEFAVPQPGLAQPAWSRLHLGGPEAVVDVDPERAAQALSLLRLGLAVRATAAARRSHEQSVAHAKVRRQFGRAIGGFGAVQQRTATREIELVAGELLIEDAVRRHAGDAPDRILATELAVSHAAAVAPRIQISAHQTLGAGGYFEGHDAPWLFRRVHADIALLPTCPAPRGTVADILIGSATGLPAVDSTPQAAAMREQARSFCAEHRSRVRLLDEDDDPAVVAAMSAREWFGMTWPAADGGRGAGLTEQLALQDETAYHQLPVANAMGAVSVVGAPVVKHGTAEQKERYLPRIRDGRLTFCLGYSEPEAGSDLASLTTTAVRDGDDWVINGTKAWIGNAHTAEYIWLAVRTDVDAKPPMAGISMFMVPMASAGIRTEPHRALSGQVCSTVTFDDVRVSDSARIGPVNRGWQVITDTLTSERLLLATELAGMSRRQFDELLATVRADPDGAAGPSGSDGRARLSGMAVRVQAVNLLLAEAAAKAESSAVHTARLTSAMAGVLAAEVAERLSRDALEILGPAAALCAPDAPGGGIFEQGLRLSVLAFLGGGTNDVQRGLIARGLGLS